MTTSATSPTSHDLLSRWEEQQSAYVAHRENRASKVMLDVLDLNCPSDLTVLDLACGPGSIADRVLSRFPQARAVATDYDPVLAQLARSILARHGRATVIDPTWHARAGRRLSRSGASTRC